MNGTPNIANKFLVNGMYPGPTVDVTDGGVYPSPQPLSSLCLIVVIYPVCVFSDLVEITVVNHLGSAAVTIHWHGLSQRGTPYMDGTRSVSQAGILPGTNFT